MTNDSRNKMVESAAALIGSQGLSATSFTDVLADSGAPRGSIYFHFPGGKRELAEDAMRWTSEQIIGHMQACTASTAGGVLRHFVGLFQHVADASDGAAGCAVAGVTVDVAASDDELLILAREVFHSWVALLAEQLTNVGISKKRAEGIATISVASVEGGLILSRAEGGPGPLNEIAKQLLLLVEP
jgi:AcrR family transcriptional regulator